jgi:hypothetical protein
VSIDTEKPNDASDDAPDPIEELLLTAYPNPDREGCPGPEAIDALGNRRIGREDPTWTHVWHCSPCFREFKAIRDARWRGEAIQRTKRKRVRLAAGVITAALVLGFITLLFRSKFSSQPQVAAITLDLFNVGIYRGSDENHQVDLPALPRKVDDIHLVLPRYSGTGKYAIAVLRSRADASALAAATALAVGSDVRAEISMRLDLSSVRPGNYVLATRREQDASVYYYPLRIQ